MIPEDQNNMTTQWCSTGRLFTTITSSLKLHHLTQRLKGNHYFRLQKRIDLLFNQTASI